MKKETKDRLLEQVKISYQEIAADFNQTRQKEIWPEIRNLVERVAVEATVLDAGCGNGRLLSVLTEKKPEYWGIDNSPALIKLAQKNYPNNKFLVDDVLELTTVPNQYFDYIFCLAVLPHIPSSELRKKTLNILSSKLKPGGRIFVSAWNLRSSAWKHKSYKKRLWLNFLKKIIGLSDLDFGDLLFPWKKANQTASSLRYYHAFKANELKKLVRRTKLQVVNFKKDRFNYWLELE